MNMAQWLCGVINNSLSSTNATTHMEHAVSNMTQQLNNDSSVSTTFNDLTPNTTVSSTGTSEKEYIRNCLWELYNNNYALDGDCWVIVDDYWDWGYGLGGITINPNGDTIYGARALHTPSVGVVGDNVDSFYNFVIHELGHSLGYPNDKPDHEHGCFTVDSNDTNGWATPMITAYGQNTNSDPDTCWEGDETPPPSLECCGHDNYVGDSWINGCGHEDRHIIGMTDCTKSNIDNNAPL